MGGNPAEGVRAQKEQQLIGTLSIAAVDCFAFRGATDVRRRLLFADEKGNVRRLTWKQARSFASADSAGIQHVSEILRTRGIWGAWG